jgi:hypothetical protein
MSGGSELEGRNSEKPQWVLLPFLWPRILVLEHASVPKDWLVGSAIAWVAWASPGTPAQLSAL